MAGFYEEKGMVRYTMILPKVHKDKIETVAKTYKITQGEVIEVLLDQMSVSLLGTHFEAKKESKGSNKSSKRSVIEAMKGLTKQQLLEVEKAIAEMKTT